MASYYQERTDRTFNLSLQTITEVWAAQEYFRRVGKMLNQFGSYANKKVTLNDKRLQLQKFIDKYMPKPSDRIFGTRHCFLIKGGKAKGGEDEWMSQSPLVRGYRMPTDYTGTDKQYAYAHSAKYPNSGNKSGFGRLGNKWEPFNVWEEMGVRKWISMLASKVVDHETHEEIPEIQPECGDILKQQVVTPPETFAKQEEIGSTLVQITKQEVELKYAYRECVNDYTYGKDLDRFFPQHRHSCLFPTTCEFLPICYGQDWKGDPVPTQVREDPIGSGLFTWRVAHHEQERKALNADN